MLATCRAFLVYYSIYNNKLTPQKYKTLIIKTLSTLNLINIWFIASYKNTILIRLYLCTFAGRFFCDFCQKSVIFAVLNSVFFAVFLLVRGL